MDFIDFKYEVVVPNSIDKLSEIKAHIKMKFNS